MTSSSSLKNLEEGLKEAIDFSKIREIGSIKENVIPVVVQDSTTKLVLIVAYINRVAFERSLKTRIATFWSTSRNELWVKGESSGNVLDIDDIYINCEQNSLIFLVTPRGSGACHTKDFKGNYRMGCYYRRIKSNGDLELV